MKWRGRNHATFDNSKDDMIIFTRYQKPNLSRRLIEARITVRDHKLKLNTEATQWVEVYLHSRLQFWAHKSLLLEKAQKTEDRVRRLRSTNRLTPSVI